MSRNILIIAAHPDDEVLGCGGFLARNLREGGETAVLILTEGCTTQYPDQPDLLARKEEEARRAMAVLGAVTVEFAGLPDMRLSMLPPAEVNRKVEDAVQAQSPDWVLVHHEGDLNRDHAIAHEAARVACRPRNGFLPQLLAYETLSSTEWGAGSFQPNTFVTLEPVDLEKKIAAFHEYRLENRPSPHPRSVEAIEALARLRGVQAGVERAEAFRLVWQRV